MEKRLCFGTEEFQIWRCRGCPWFIECKNIKNKLPKRKRIKIKQNEMEKI